MKDPRRRIRATSRSSPKEMSLNNREEMREMRSEESAEILMNRWIDAQEGPDDPVDHGED